MTLRLIKMTTFVLVLSVFCLNSTNAQDRQFRSLTKQLNSADADVAEKTQAVQAIGEYGPLAAGAVPTLLNMLKTDDLALRHEIVITLGRIGSDARVAVPTLSRLLNGKSVILKHSAIRSLGKIGPGASSAVPGLKKLLKSDNSFLRIPAARSLVQIQSQDSALQKAVIPVLVKGLDDQQDDVRNTAVIGLSEIGEAAVPAIVAMIGASSASCTHACDALAEMGPAAQSSIPTLIQKLSDADSTNCWHAASALGAIGSRPEKSVPALSKLLSHSSADVRLHAALALAEFGTEAKSAVPALVNSLNDSNETVRRSAIWSIGEIGPAASNAIPELNKTLEDASGVIAIHTMEALGKIGSAAVPMLTEKLDDEHFQILAAHVLGEIGPAAKSAVSKLTSLIRSKDKDVQFEAMLAIANIGPDAQQAAPALLKLLASDDKVLKTRATFVLTKLNYDQAIPEIKKIWDNEEDDEFLQFAAAWSLATFHPDNKKLIEQVMPNLIWALDDERPRVRKEVSNLLAEIGPEAVLAIPTLINTLDTDDPEVRADVLTALAEINPGHESSIVAAVKHLDDFDPSVRYSAVFVLGRAGSAAKHAVSALSPWLKSRVEFDRVIAAWALVQIDTQPAFVKTAIPLMITALSLENPEARIEAAETLGRIGDGKNASILKALQAATKDEVVEVRAAAQKSLDNLKK